MIAYILASVIPAGAVIAGVWYAGVLASVPADISPSGISPAEISHAEVKLASEDFEVGYVAPKPTLENIPIDIRFLLYDYLLLDKNVTYPRPDHQGGRHETFPLPGPRFNFETALFRVNKAISCESLAYFRSKNTFIGVSMGEWMDIETSRYAMPMIIANKTTTPPEPGTLAFKLSALNYPKTRLPKARRFSIITARHFPTFVRLLNLSMALRRKKGWGSGGCQLVMTFDLQAYAYRASAGELPDFSRSLFGRRGPSLLQYLGSLRGFGRKPHINLEPFDGEQSRVIVPIIEREIMSCNLPPPNFDKEEMTTRAVEKALDYREQGNYAKAREEYTIVALVLGMRFPSTQQPIKCLSGLGDALPLGNSVYLRDMIQLQLLVHASALEYDARQKNSADWFLYTAFTNHYVQCYRSIDTAYNSWFLGFLGERQVASARSLARAHTGDTRVSAELLEIGIKNLETSLRLLPHKHTERELKTAVALRERRQVN